MKNFYNIHNFVTVAISSECLDLAASYDHYFREFRVSQENKSADYEVHEFADFVIPRNYKNAGGIWGFEHGIYFPKEKYALTFEDGKIKEYTRYANRATNLWLQLLLLASEVSCVHGAGIELNGKGIILPAFGGAGKTVLIAGMRASKTFKFFGDDYVFVDENRNMYAYPSDFSIYDYHVAEFPELKKTKYEVYLRKRNLFAPYYEAKRGANFLVKRVLHTGEPLFKGWGADYVKVPACELIPQNQIGVRTNLYAGVFLSRYSGDKVCIEELTAEAMSREVLGVLYLEFGGSMSYLFTLGAFGVIDVAEFEKTQRTVIENCFSKIKCYRILVPFSMSPAEYRIKVVQQIKNLVI